MEENACNAGQSQQDSHSDLDHPAPDPVPIAMRKVLKARDTYTPECVKLTKNLLELRIQNAVECEVKLNMPQSSDVESEGDTKIESIEYVQAESIRNTVSPDCLKSCSEQVEKLMLDAKEVELVLKKLESVKHSKILMHLNHQL